MGAEGPKGCGLAMRSSSYKYHRGQWYLVLRSSNLTELVPVEPALAEELQLIAREIAAERRAFDQRCSDLVDRTSQEVREGKREPRQLRGGKQ